MELLFSVFLTVVLLFLLITAINIPTQTITGDIINAGGFPIAIIVLALLLLMLLIYKYVKQCKEDGVSLLAGLGIPKSALISVGIVTGYIVLMNVVGFAISTLAFTFINARAMGYKKYTALTAFTVILTVAVVLVFGKLFYIPLPRGMGFFRELSYYIY